MLGKLRRSSSFRKHANQPNQPNPANQPKAVAPAVDQLGQPTPPASEVVKRSWSWSSKGRRKEKESTTAVTLVATPVDEDGQQQFKRSWSWTRRTNSAPPPHKDLAIPDGHDTTIDQQSTAVRAAVEAARRQATAEIEAAARQAAAEMEAVKLETTRLKAEMNAAKREAAAEKERLEAQVAKRLEVEEARAREEQHRRQIPEGSTSKQPQVGTETPVVVAPPPSEEHSSAGGSALIADVASSRPTELHSDSLTCDGVHIATQPGHGSKVQRANLHCSQTPDQLIHVPPSEQDTADRPPTSKDAHGNEMALASVTAGTQEATAKASQRSSSKVNTVAGIPDDDLPRDTEGKPSGKIHSGHERHADTDSPEEAPENAAPYLISSLNNEIKTHSMASFPPLVTTLADHPAEKANETPLPLRIWLKDRAGLDPRIVPKVIAGKADAHARCALCLSVDLLFTSALACPST